MKVLLFAGAGTSVELGVPSMAGLASGFLDYSSQWSVEPDLVQGIMNDNLDIEHLIEELDHICLAGPSLQSIGQDIGGLLARAEKVRAEVEWFVQHVAERVAARDAQLMWGSVLRVPKSVEITFITTNYDRAIELAANGERISLTDGFEPFAEGETVQWIGFQENRRGPLLVKLHGSTDWYTDDQTDKPRKLRHPMPLFGGAELSLSEGRKLRSALILPSREKLLTKSPYPWLLQTFLNAADCCDLALFVGSSLRDGHIREAARTIARRTPVFIINPNSGVPDIESTTVISQCASTFLMSTLPNALLTSEPLAVLQQVSNANNPATQDMLLVVRDLLDTKAETSKRCHAVDKLDEMEATLTPFQINQLLNDHDSTVARYAMGLIPLSTSQKYLIERAECCSHSGNPAFRDDLKLLRSVCRVQTQSPSGTGDDVEQR